MFYALFQIFLSHKDLAGTDHFPRDLHHALPKHCSLIRTGNRACHMQKNTFLHILCPVFSFSLFSCKHFHTNSVHLSRISHPLQNADEKQYCHYYIAKQTLLLSCDSVDKNLDQQPAGQSKVCAAQYAFHYCAWRIQWQSVFILIILNGTFSMLWFQFLFIMYYALVDSTCPMTPRCITDFCFSDFYSRISLH